MSQVLVIKGELTDLNSYVQAERGNKFAGANIKKEETNRIWVECKQQQIRPQKKPCFITFLWYCSNSRKDKDNIAFAKKFILDGLVLAGVLESDRWDFISGFLDLFHVDKENPRIEVCFGVEPDEIKFKNRYNIGQ